MKFLLQHLLIESAKKHPDNVAIVFQDNSITYKELDGVTDKLAATLVKNGVKKGDRVGIYVNKSIPSIVSIHGILKAGGVYVPLDPKAPLSRLAYIVQNCNIECILTSGKKLNLVAQMFPEKNPLRFIVLMDEPQNEQFHVMQKLFNGMKF